MAPSNTKIEDPEMFVLLNKIGTRNLSFVGALLQNWENRTKKGLPLTFAEWVMKENFVQTTERQCKSAETDISALKADVLALRKDLAAAAEQKSSSDASGEDSSKISALEKKLGETREDLAESQAGICRLEEANKDLVKKYDQLMRLGRTASTICDIDEVRNVLCRFNRKNPVAVANGDPSGVTFGGHVKISGVDSLAAFLATEHARKLRLPSDVLVRFKVFEADGKLVTLSKEYHGGVGYSFLWKKKKTTKGATVGWSTTAAKKYDPRLATDPATGANYVDPQTGERWVYPEVEDNFRRKKKRTREQSEKGGDDDEEDGGDDEVEVEGDKGASSTGVVPVKGGKEDDVFI